MLQVKRSRNGWYLLSAGRFLWVSGATLAAVIADRAIAAELLAIRRAFARSA